MVRRGEDEEGEIEEGEIEGGPPQPPKRSVSQTWPAKPAGVSYVERQGTQRGGSGSAGSHSGDEGIPQHIIPAPPPPPPPPPPTQFQELMDRRIELAQRRIKGVDSMGPKIRPRRSDIDMTLEVHRRYPRREIPLPPGRPWDRESTLDYRRRPEFNPETRRNVRPLGEERFRDRHAPPFLEPSFRRPRPPPSPILYALTSKIRRDISPPLSPRPSVLKVETPEAKPSGEKKSTSQSSSESSKPSSSNKSSNKGNNAGVPKSNEIGETLQQRGILAKSDTISPLQRRFNQSSFHSFQSHHRMSHYHLHHHTHYPHSHYVPRGGYRGYQGGRFLDTDLGEFNEFDKRRNFPMRGRHSFHGSVYDHFRDMRELERVREMQERRRRYPYELDRVDEVVQDIKLLTGAVGADDASKDLRGVCDRLVQAISKMERLEPMVLKRAVRGQDVPNFSFLSRRILTGLKTLTNLAENDDQPGQLSLISHTLRQAAEVKHKILNTQDQKEFEDLLAKCMAAASRRQHKTGSDSEGGSSSMSKRKRGAEESSASKQNNFAQKGENIKGEDDEEEDLVDSKRRRHTITDGDGDTRLPKGVEVYGSEEKRDEDMTKEHDQQEDVDNEQMPARIKKNSDDSGLGSSCQKQGKTSSRKTDLQGSPHRSQPWDDTNQDVRSTKKDSKRSWYQMNEDVYSPIRNGSPSKGQHRYQLDIEGMFEEPVTPETSLDDQPLDTPYSNDRKRPILVFPPESPVTSPLASFSGQFDDWSCGKLNEDYFVSQDLSKKKFITLVIQVEEVLIDVVDIQEFGEMFQHWVSVNRQDSQVIQVSYELFFLENKLFKLRPGVRDCCVRWKQFLNEICFYSQLDNAKQILEIFDFFGDSSECRLIQGVMQELEEMECDVLWVSHTQPRWLSQNDNIQFFRVMGYQYFSQVKRSASQNSQKSYWQLKADESRKSNAMLDLTKSLQRIRQIMLLQPLTSLCHCLKVVKERVLKGVILAVLVNNRKLKEKFEEIGQQLGAQIVNEQCYSQATHVLEVEQMSQKYSFSEGVLIVDGSWLLCSEVRLAKADESLFAVK